MCIVDTSSLLRTVAGLRWLERIGDRPRGAANPLGRRKGIDVGGATQPTAAARRAHAAERNLKFNFHRLVVDMNHAGLQAAGDGTGARCQGQVQMS